MKKPFFINLLAGLVLLVFVIQSSAVSVFISNSKGTVKIYKSVQNIWVVGGKGQMLNEKDKLETGANGTAELTFEDGTTIAVKQGTSLEMSKLIEATEISMTKGRFRAKVKAVAAGRNFNIKTPCSVASIRGTEFVFSLTITGASELVVLEGKVEFGGLVGDILSNMIEVNPSEKLSIGTDGISGEIKIVDETEKNSLEQEFVAVTDNSPAQGTEDQQQVTQEEQKTEEAKQEQTTEEQKQTEQEALREEVHSFVQDTKVDMNDVRDIGNQLQEADFSTGRTMQDIHGNLVRVEQLIQRPDAYTMQFLNLTKRTDYTNKGHFAYTGQNAARLDSMEAKTTFNQALPNDITEFPKFFDSNKDNIFITQTSFIMSSKMKDPLDPTKSNTDSYGVETNVITNKDEELKETTFLSNGTDKWIFDQAKYDAAKAADPAGYESRSAPEQVEIRDQYGNVTGEYYLDQYGKQVEDVTSLWGWGEAPILLVKDGTNGTVTSKFWLQNEAYVINNSGRILDTDYFTSNSNSDPFSILKEIAFEQIMYVKQGNDISTATDYFKNKNIDLIFTPDIFLAVAKKFATQISSSK
jgi:hypothetical protein